MIGFDTNVLIRFLTQDEPEQARRATDVVESRTGADPGFVSLVTLAEVHWVLRRAYRLSPTDALAVVEGLLGVPELLIQDVGVARQAVQQAASGADFADALIAEIGRGAGCTATVTFDRGAARSAGMTLL